MKPRKEKDRRLLGAITLAVIVLFTVGVFAGLIGPNMFSGGGRTVTAVFQNAQQLIPGDEVRVQGVDEGSVKSVKLGPGGRSATVTMTVDSSAGPLYRDATATLAWKTLLGGAFNVDLTRGTPSAGTLGSTPIPMANTSNQVELDDLLSVDSGGAKTGLTTIFPQMAIALSNPQPPAQALNTLSNVAPAVATGVGALRGLVPDSDLRSLVTGTASTVQALNAPDDGLRTVVQGAASTVAVTAAREDDIKTALDEATPAMDQTKTTFAQLQTTLKLADPLLRTLVGPSSEVAPTIRALFPTVTGASTLLQHAVPLLHSLRPTLASLASTAQKGLPLLTQVQPSFTRLQKTILPYMNTVDPGTDHTAAEMIGPTTEALGPDIAGQEDQNGHFIRFPATVGSSPFYLPCQTYLGNPADHSQLLACSSLQTDLSAFLGYNPLSSLTSAASSAGSAKTPAAAHSGSGAAAPSTSSSGTASGSGSGASGGQPGSTGSGTAASGAGSGVQKLLNSVAGPVLGLLGKVTK